MSNQDALSEDLESDPFLNSTLQRFTCELYYRFGSFLAPLSDGIITNRHYLSDKNIAGNKNVGENRGKGRDTKLEESNARLAKFNLKLAERLAKYHGDIMTCCDCLWGRYSSLLWWWSCCAY